MPLINRMNCYVPCKDGAVKIHFTGPLTYISRQYFKGKSHPAMLVSGFHRSRAIRLVMGTLEPASPATSRLAGPPHMVTRFGEIWSRGSPPAGSGLTTSCHGCRQRPNDKETIWRSFLFNIPRDSPAAIQRFAASVCVTCRAAQKRRLAARKCQDSNVVKRPSRQDTIMKRR